MRWKGRTVSSPGGRCPGAPRSSEMGLHVGLIGVGRIGVVHAETLHALPGVARLTVADVDAARARTVADELGVETVETPAALFEQEIDAVVIATPTPGHAP